MNEGLIPRRYAKALYKVDTERNSAARSYELMNTLIGSFGENPQLGDVVNNPFIASVDKAKLIMTAAGAVASDTTFRDFIKLLENNRRIGIIHAIALAYTEIYRRENNICRVEVVAATQLDSAVEMRIKEVVKKHLENATIEFSTHIDQEIIGGFIVNIDNERLDASLRNRLKQLRLSLLN